MENSRLKSVNSIYIYRVHWLKWIMVDGIDDGHRGIIPNVIGQYWMQWDYDCHNGIIMDWKG